MAILEAAVQFHQAGEPATLVELALRSCVGYDVALYTVDNLKRAGALEIVGHRPVEYRNRPVAEYALARPGESQGGLVVLDDVMSRWGR